MEEKQMNLKIATATLFLLTIGMTASTTETANAVVYCQYISYPVGCVARPGVVLGARPVARAAAER